MKEDPLDKYARLLAVTEKALEMFQETSWPDDIRIRKRQIAIEARLDELIRLMSFQSARVEIGRRKRMKFNESIHQRRAD